MVVIIWFAIEPDGYGYYYTSEVVDIVNVACVAQRMMFGFLPRSDCENCICCQLAKSYADKNIICTI